jgi:hypothetical protein
LSVDERRHIFLRSATVAATPEDERCFPDLGANCFTYWLGGNNCHNQPDMRVFMRKQNVDHATTHSQSTKPSGVNAAHSGDMDFAVQLQHTIGNRAVQRLIAQNLSVPVFHVQQSARGAIVQRQPKKDSRKLQIVSIDAPRRVKVSEWLEERTARGTERQELYWVDFQVDDKGVMRASVRTVSPDGKLRSGVLQFGDEFRRALDHFEKGGVRVTEFEGDWSYMSKDELSENLKVFKEGLEQGLTREKAAQRTPTAKVVAASGFEVTHVENVPESQPHLAEQNLRRWRVRAIFRRPPVAPVAPTGTAGGSRITARGGGGGGPSARSAIGWGLAELAILYLLGLIIGPVLKAKHERDVARSWDRIRPKVQEDLNQRQDDIEKLLRDTNRKKTIYANVHMDMITSQACWEGGCVEGYYGMNYVPPAKISTENINRTDSFSAIDPAPAGNIIHRPVIFSFPIAEPSALVLPHIEVIHNLLARVTRDLTAVRDRTAGEAVALDHLNVALEATDYKRSTKFQTKSAAERFKTTVSEVDYGFDMLKMSSSPAVQEMAKLLGGVRFLIQQGLAEEWPLMVE